VEDFDHAQRNYAAIAASTARWLESGGDVSAKKGNGSARQFGKPYESPESRIGSVRRWAADDGR
jgi:hypothetical protein